MDQQPNSLDPQTTLADLKQIMATFVAERDWQQFHAPKNLAMSVAIEAGELMEHFQWIDMETSRRLKDDPAKKQAIGEELIDVLSYCVALANALELDIATAWHAKLAKNALKYPADEFRGRSGRE